MGLIETPLSKDAPDADRAVSACQSSLRCVDIIVGKSSHGLQLNRYSGCQKCSAEPRPCQSAGLTQRGRRAQRWRSIVYCVRGVLCVFSQCAAKGRSVSEVSTMNGGRGTPSTAGRRLPPLRALRQNAPGLDKTGG